MLDNPFYDQIAGKSLEDVKKLGEQIIKNHNDGVKKLEESTAKDTDWLREVDDFETDISLQSSAIEILDMIHPDKVFRDFGAEFSINMSKEWSRYNFNQKIFKKFKDNVNAGTLDACAKYLYRETMDAYRRSGVSKSKAIRIRLEEIQNEMSELSNKFSINIAENTPEIELSPKELRGCFKEFIKDNINPQGRVVISLVSSAITHILQNCEVKKTREKVLDISLNYAKDSNWEIMPRYLNLTNDYAKLAGYKNYAWLATEDKMIEDPIKSANFIENLISTTKVRVAKELELIKTKMKVEGDTSDFSYADIDFYGNKVAKSLVEIDEERIKEFFPYQYVSDAILRIFEGMFGIEFRLNTDIELWHDEVVAYEVLESGIKIGLIYLDMHPRKGKYNHACSVGIVGGRKGYCMPQNILICNFTKPVEGKSFGLQSFDEVETFFHEFGHLVHGILGGQNQEWSNFAGTSVQMDFVEAPSQLLEEVLLDSEVLKKLSCHHKDKSQIDDKSIASLQKRERIFSGNKLKGLFIARQAALSKQSLQIYTSGDITNEKLAQIEKESVEEVFGIYGDYHMIYEFGHVVGGYSSNYYTYMWSLAIAKDLFTKFNKKNLLDPKIGLHYRQTILEKGGSKPAAELARDFLGRDWNMDAFEQYLDEGIELLG